MKKEINVNVKDKTPDTVYEEKPIRKTKINGK